MLAMGGGLGLTKAQYHNIDTSEKNAERITTAREVLWNACNPVEFFAIVCVHKCCACGASVVLFVF